VALEQQDEALLALYWAKEGATDEEIAERLRVSKRTAQRRVREGRALRLVMWRARLNGATGAAIWRGFCEMERQATGEAVQRQRELLFWSVLTAAPRDRGWGKASEDTRRSVAFDRRVRRDRSVGHHTSAHVVARGTRVRAPHSRSERGG
jgi:hypothetical protein